MAGKGFTVKKDWDNPREHAMPADARVPAEMRVGPVVVAPATVLAPMAGVTDTVFRRFIRHASLFTAATVDESHPSGKDKDAARVGHPAPTSRSAVLRVSISTGDVWRRGRRQYSRSGDRRCIPFSIHR